MFSRRQGVRVQPWSTNQNNIRTTLHIIGTRWNTTLTEAQRLAWNALAASMTKQDQLRQAAPLSGQNWWMRLNFANWWNGTGYVDDPPATLQSAPAPTITAVTATASPQKLLITVNRIPLTDEWFPIAASKPQNIGRYNFARLLCGFAWFEHGWTNPTDIISYYNSTIGTLIAGKKIALQIRSITPYTGILSSSHLITAIVS
jgi:hypothetical protein